MGETTMASWPSWVPATSCGGPCTVCSRPSTVPLITGGNVDASMTTRLSEGAGSGKVARPSTRTNLPSCAETMMSAHNAAGDTTRPRLSSSPAGILDRNECIAVLLVVASMCCLLGGDARALDHVGSSREIALDKRAELLGRAGDGLQALARKRLPHFRRIQNLRDVLVELGNDVLGRRRRHEQPVPEVDVEIGISGLGERGNVGRTARGVRAS